MCGSSGTRYVMEKNSKGNNDDKFERWLVLKAETRKKKKFIIIYFLNYKTKDIILKCMMTFF